MPHMRLPRPSARRERPNLPQPPHKRSHGEGILRHCPEHGATCVLFPCQQQPKHLLRRWQGTHDTLSVVTKLDAILTKRKEFLPDQLYHQPYALLFQPPFDCGHLEVSATSDGNTHTPKVALSARWSHFPETSASGVDRFPPAIPLPSSRRPQNRATAMILGSEKARNGWVARPLHCQPIAYLSVPQPFRAFGEPGIIVVTRLRGRGNDGN